MFLASLVLVNRAVYLAWIAGGPPGPANNYVEFYGHWAGIFLVLAGCLAVLGTLVLIVLRKRRGK